MALIVAYLLSETVNPSCRCSIPGIHSKAWHIVGAHYLFVESMKDLSEAQRGKSFSQGHTASLWWN